MTRSKPDGSENRDRPEAGGASEAILGFADRLRNARVEQPEQRKTFESWVAFRVAGRSLALPVSHVREILRLEDLTGVPNAPKPVAGVMNLRGHVLPVLDTHAMLGLPSALATDATRVLICLLDNRPIGLIVDGVAGLEKIQAELVQSPDSGEPLFEIVKGILPRGDRKPLLLLEPDRLFAGKPASLN